MYLLQANKINLETFTFWPKLFEIYFQILVFSFQVLVLNKIPNKQIYKCEILMIVNLCEINKISLG